MELGLLNLTPAAGLVDEAGFAVSEMVDGDAFTKLIAQLGGAVPAAGATAPADDVALAMAAGVAGLLAPAAPRSLKAELPIAAEKEGTDAATPDTGDADGLDLAALGLPPLLAALMTPPVQAAAPVPDGEVAPSPDGTAGAPPATVMPLPIEVSLPDAPGGAAPMSPAAPDTTTTGKVPPAPAKLPTEPAAPAKLSAELAASAKLPVEPPAPAKLPLEFAALPMVATAARGRVDVAPHPSRAKSVSPVESLAVPTTVATAPIAPNAQVLPLPTAAPIEGAAMQPQTEAAPAAEIILERQLDFAHEGEWLDQLAKDIARTAGDGQLRFKLNPETLGSLHVELTQGAAGASVRLTADTEAARTIIADARPQLIAEARAQGVRIAEAHVDLGSGGHSQAGHGQRDGRELPERTYLTSWKPESAEEGVAPPRRSTSERYA